MLFLCPVNDGTEKILKRLAGRTEVEDALEELDTLTREETSMTLARNLEVTHRVDGNTMAIKDSIDQNIKAMKDGMYPFLSS